MKQKSNKKSVKAYDENFKKQGINLKVKDDFDYLMHNKTIVLIEWAIFMQDFLPKNYINISFKPLEDNESRLIEVEVIGSNKNPYHDIVQRWLNE